MTGDNSLVHKLRMMVAVKLHLDATYYAQHPALKSVDEKSQSVMGGKLSSSYRTLFELTQGLRDSKTSELNCSYVALAQKDALIICHNRVCHECLYSCIALPMVCKIFNVYFFSEGQSSY